ncbi:MULTISPECIES: CvpA family protein [Legionella]|uniref:Colicin V n=1 Tax=Legionella maceachernii TaxID=466 RepID=A0A0W0W1A3_9GAMM|nr:CvpA family protein [Legionella maceachernii]KTD26171.1 colicin V [Legionella maceachernii]SJZ71957.1 membrane protein required for colicin V production [Legionella maceachernii]SUP02399.1 Pur regulon 18 kDa protein [Legionella maceachernii]
MLYWVDLAIIVIIGLSVLTGLIRGFVKELIALCVWILAFWLAYHHSQSLDPWLQKYIQDKTARTVTAFILILLATLIVGGIVNGMLSFILKRSGLSGTDRILGMAFGFARGVFIVALIMVVIKMTSLPYDQYSRESKLYAKFDPLVSWLYSVMPDFIKKVHFFERQPEIRKPIENLPNKEEKTSLIDLNDYELSDA